MLTIGLRLVKQYFCKSNLHVKQYGGCEPIWNFILIFIYSRHLSLKWNYHRLRIYNTRLDTSHHLRRRKCHQFSRGKNGGHVEVGLLLGGGIRHITATQA